MNQNLPMIRLQHPLSIRAAEEEIAKKHPPLSPEDRDLIRSVKEQIKVFADSRNHRDSEYMTVKEVAKLLGKDPSTIRRWTERENFPLPVIKKPCNVQDTWIFERNAVIKWAELFMSD